MKKLLCLLVLTLIFTGCGKQPAESDIKEPKNNGAEQQLSEELAKSRVAKLMTGDYYMKYSMKVEGTDSIIEVSKKGEKTASKTDTTEGTVRTVIEGNTVYTIMDSQKMIMKSTVDTENTTNEENPAENYNYLDNEIDENDTFTTGEETVDGTKYYYENFDDAKFYFIGDKLKLIKAEDLVIKVLECETKGVDSMFNIPKDYTDFSSITGGGAADISSESIPEEYLKDIPEEYLQYMN